MAIYTVKDADGITIKPGTEVKPTKGGPSVTLNGVTNLGTRNWISVTWQDGTILAHHPRHFGLTVVVTPGPCQYGLCIASFCDDVSHVDATGDTWTQREGTQYCPIHAEYDDCHAYSRATREGM